MRGVLKSVSGPPIVGLTSGAPGWPSDGRVEVTIVLDDVPVDVLRRMFDDVGRGLWLVAPADGHYVVVEGP